MAPDLNRKVVELVGRSYTIEIVLDETTDGLSLETGFLKANSRLPKPGS